MKLYSPKQTLEMYNKVADNISSKYSNFISREEIIQRLMGSGNVYADTTIHNAGEYSLKTGDILLNCPLADTDITFTHECIHKIGHNVNNKFNMGLSHITITLPPETLGEALNEGATEYLTYSLFDKPTVTEECCGFNLQLPKGFNSSYFFNYAIVRQMHKLLGSDTLFDSVLNSNNSFQDEFSNKFGDFLYIFTRENLDVLALEQEKYEHAKENNAADNILLEYENDIVEMFENIQYNLISRCFNIKFAEAAHNPKGLKNILTELKDFRQYIGIPCYKKSFFDSYYNYQCNKIQKYIDSNDELER